MNVSKDVGIHFIESNVVSSSEKMKNYSVSLELGQMTVTADIFLFHLGDCEKKIDSGKQFVLTNGGINLTMTGALTHYDITANFDDGETFTGCFGNNRSYFNESYYAINVPQGKVIKEVTIYA